MLKSLFTLILTLPILTTSAQSWTQLTDFPGSARDDGATFVINNKAYCFTGVSSGCTSDGFVFDSATETWSTMATLPGGNERQYAAAFSYNGKGYMMGGINCSNVRLNDFWQYSPTTNSWTALPNFPGVGRYGTSNFVIKNRAYITGGTLANNTLTNEVWEYNFTTTTWTQKNNLPLNAMHRGSAFGIDTLGYVCYGIDNNSAFNHYLYVYNYVTDSWRRVSNLALPSRFYSGTAVCSNKGCLYGGVDSLNIISNNYTIFNPADSSLTNFSGIPTIARKGGMAFALNNIFYITTGYNSANVRIKETWKNTALVGLNEIKIKNEKFTIYPNPANPILNIELEILNLDNTRIQLVNTLGQILIDEKVSTQHSSINIQHFSDGIYFIKVFNGSQSLPIQKIIKN